jgi:molybdopterin biosynthesis enzyme
MLITLYEYVIPSLALMSGVRPEEARPSLRLPLRASVKAGGKQVTWLLGRVVSDEAGAGVEPVRGTGSADFVSLGAADGYFPVSEGTTDLAPGAWVDYRGWRRCQ